jgi:ATP/maltotriose-dependent transcriptional regulator MalT
MRCMDVPPPNLLASLNTREREILQFIASECTVKWYLHHLYAKPGVKRRTMAVKRARQLGIA